MGSAVNLDAFATHATGDEWTATAAVMDGAAVDGFSFDYKRTEEYSAQTRQHDRGNQASARNGEFQIIVVFHVREVLTFVSNSTLYKFSYSMSVNYINACRFMRTAQPAPWPKT